MSGRYQEPFPLRRMVGHPVFWGVLASVAGGAGLGAEQGGEGDAGERRGMTQVEAQNRGQRPARGGCEAPAHGAGRALPGLRPGGMATPGPPLDKRDILYDSLSEDKDVFRKDFGEHLSSVENFLRKKLGRKE